MNIYTSEIKKIIWSWSWKVSKTCQAIEAADVAQELWLEVIQAAKGYDPDKKAALSSYLYPMIRWRALNILKEQAKLKKEKNCDTQSLSTIVVPPQTESMETVVTRVRNKIIEQQQRTSITTKVFDTLIDPPAKLKKITKGNDLTDKQSVIRATHVACLLGVSVQVVNRSMRLIKETMEEELG